MKNDKNVVLQAIRNDEHSLKFAGIELKNNKEYMIEYIKEFPNSLQYTSFHLKNDKEFILECINCLQFKTSYCANTYLSNNNIRLRI